MRFLHTADWHLGKRLHDFSLLEVQRELVEGLIDLVAESRPDAVVVAGDVFDTQVPHVGALELWEAAVDGIVGEHEVPMVVIPGNHDHAGRLSVHSGLASRAGLHFIRSLAQCEQPVEIGGVAFYGVPFHKPVHVNATYRDEQPGIGDFDYAAAMTYALDRVRGVRSRGMPAVLLAHAFVDGAGEEPEGEDAIQVGGAGGIPASAFDGFDYVALGHIHSARRLGNGQLHYSGSLYPYSFSEAGQEKSLQIVELDAAGKVVALERLQLGASREVKLIEGRSFDDVLQEAERLTRQDREHFTLVRVSDEEPLEHGLARLREWYPNSLLEQPAIGLGGVGPQPIGDYRTLTAEDAFRRFYRDTFGEALAGLEEEILLEALRDEEPDESAEARRAETEPRRKAATARQDAGAGSSVAAGGGSS